MDKLEGILKKKFDIHPSIVFKLGEDLISDEVQALVELIKNAFDADADYAKITIETWKKNNIKETTRYPKANGFILIEDNGCGMDTKAIDQGWLTISNLLKREMKSKKKITNKGRTPLGDKGLGRLGAQRLGYNVEIFTKPENEEDEYHVAFSWRDFQGVEKLSQVPVYYNAAPSKQKPGTALLISDIIHPVSLRDEISLERLQNELSQMISPYKEIKDFMVSVTIDGKELELAEISDNVLNASQLRYFFEFDGERFEIKGQARLNFFRPQDKDDIQLFRSLVEIDNGQNFFKFISKKEKFKDFHLKKSGEAGWYVKYGRKISFEDIDKLELINGIRANPGKFHGRIDSFDLGIEEEKWQNIFDSISEYRKYINKLSGIKVYRDGFGIRVDRDWLRIGQQATSGKSYYGLRLGNILGYVALSARDNSKLEETTDREGFKVNSYYNNFFKILQEFIGFTQDVQQFLRREWVNFRNKYQEKVTKIKGSSTPEEMSKEIKKSIAKAKTYRHSTGELKTSITQTAAKTQETVKRITQKLTEKSPGVIELNRLIIELKDLIKVADDSIARLDEYLKEIEGLEDIETVRENQIRLLREQLEEVYETVSLGLTAESLSHEIHTIADRLAKQAGEIRIYLKNRPDKDPRVFSFVEHVGTSINALRKQMAHLAPSLKYVRERKKNIDLLSFCQEFVSDYYKDRFEKNNIKVKINTTGKENFSIYMNQGKVIQVFDNIFLNSEYWLREDIRVGNIEQGIITVTIVKPFVRIQDNGKGVIPYVETTLFEPFISAKGKEKGRGLGLFIVKQLLDSDGCTISLLPERNRNNRQYIFEIDFTGALHDD
jgi:signal transduction histidine kinase